MTASSIIYLILGAIGATGLSFLMYGFKSNVIGNLRWILGSLRFVTLMGVLLLLVNPKITTISYSTEKPKLSVLVDNSSSIKELNKNADVLQLVKEIKEYDELNKKFDVGYYSFGSNFKLLDSLTFTDNNTNIAQALKSIAEVNRREIAPVILISDGNQTLGNDYEFISTNFQNPIYPVIAGDSTKYTDLRIERLNTNKYAFLKNQFPVEVSLVYSGNDNVTSLFIIKQGNATVYSQKIDFSEINNSKTLNFTLSASQVGLQKYFAQIVPLPQEKNKINNSKPFAVEVIDQATNVLIVSQMVHPDLGALKNSITTNEQRTVSILKPKDVVSTLNDYELLIFYQPDRSFSEVLALAERLNKNILFITGLQTDWEFLNTLQSNFSKEISGQKEEIQAILNPNFGVYAVPDIGLENYRPLKTLFGAMAINVPNETLLKQTVNGFETGSPLLATMDLNGKRQAIWDGEGLWKWRAQSFIDTNSFQSFDDFIGGLVQYLASTKRRNRLEVNHELFYYNNDGIKISAQYFDQNFVFSPSAALIIKVINTDTNATVNFPLLLKNNFYEVDLNSLQAGDYKYVVSVTGEPISQSGNFTILDYNVEQQFLTADINKLNRIAENTKGKSYFMDQKNSLLKDLMENDQFKSIEKQDSKTLPLIDWKYLLAIIVLSLSAEWFIRKYNGLI